MADRWTRRVGTLIAALAVAFPAWAQTPGVDVRVGVSATGTRVVIDSPSAISVVSREPEDGRVSFTLEGLSLDDTLRGSGRGLVKDWRLEGQGERARLTLDLVGEGEVGSRFVIPPSAGASRYRYVIDLTAPHAGRVAVAQIAKRVKRAPTLTSSRKVIVIDAGHGGHDPGAQSVDANEKDITLAAALHLRRRLLRDGDYKVVMTRTNDTFVPLEERVRIARRAGADLFIALHADSAGANDSTHGASVYTLSDHGVTRVNEVLNGHEWFTHAAPRNDPAVKGILLDLTQRSTLNRSNMFAQLLVDHLSQRIDVLPRTHRDAGYFVLLAPDVPAVLLEMGFISSREDEARLTNPAKRDELMDTVADAIDAYFRGDVTLAAN